MTTGSVHHRAIPRSRVRRLALPAVIGLTLVSLWSLAPAVEPSASKGRAQPRIVDFAKLAKQKSEARRLLDAAQSAAAKGDLETARHHANLAATYPIEWNLGEKTPARFLEELEANPQRFSELGNEVREAPIVDAPRQQRKAERRGPSHNSVADRKVIELAFPADRSGTTEDADQKHTLLDSPIRSKTNLANQSPSHKQQLPNTLRTLGFKTSDSDPIESLPAGDVLHSQHRYTPIPSIEELANSATEPNDSVLAVPSTADVTNAFRKPKSNSTERSRFQTVEKGHLLESSRTQLSAAEAPPQTKNVVPIEVESQPDHSTTLLSNADDNEKIPQGMLDDSNAAEPQFQPRLRPLSHETKSEVPSALPTTVIHEFRFSERAAPIDPATSVQSSNASILLANLTGLLMAGMFGTLLLLIVVAVVVLRKFGPNPQFTLKVDVNHPQTAASLEPMAKAAVRPLAITPVYAQQRQLAEELELQQEDAMMRQVFEDNLKLREQLEDSSIAA